MNKEIAVVAVHIGNRWAVTDEGKRLYISDFYDEFGEETKNPDRAVTGVCECPGGWITLDFNEFQEVDYLH